MSIATMVNLTRFVLRYVAPWAGLAALAVVTLLASVPASAVPVTVAGCYVFDAGSPGDPLPVLVSDTTHDGLCHEDADATAIVPVTWRDSWEGTSREHAWQCLLDLGYRGDPTDQREALYPTLADLDDCR